MEVILYFQYHGRGAWPHLAQARPGPGHDSGTAAGLAGLAEGYLGGQIDEVSMRGGGLKVPAA